MKREKVHVNDYTHKCFLCGANGTVDPLDEHHIFGAANRTLCGKLGLTVPLCHNKCHENGPRSAHKCKETADFLHRYGQRKWMLETGGTVDEFRALIGKNYLDEDEIAEIYALHERGAFEENDFRLVDDDPLDWVC